MVALNHVRSAGRTSPPVSFEAVNRLALANVSGVVAAMLTSGRRVGGEWVARNPLRADKSPGSFKVNLATGRWADFATGDRGGDLVSLAAYLAGCSQYEAAKRLGDALGLEVL